jgi:site-specific DNA recombinase
MYSEELRATQREWAERALRATRSLFSKMAVHSFSRFFRDQFQFEFYVRKLAKNGVGSRRTLAMIP